MLVTITLMTKAIVINTYNISSHLFNCDGRVILFRFREGIIFKQIYLILIL